MIFSYEKREGREKGGVWVGDCLFATAAKWTSGGFFFQKTERILTPLRPILQLLMVV